MIDIVFSDSFASTLKYYYQKRHLDGQVLALPMYLSLGTSVNARLWKAVKPFIKSNTLIIKPLNN